MPQTIRYFTKALLIKAAAIADKRGYNNRLPKEFFDSLPDEFKFPVSFHLVHQHKAGKPCEPHIRASFVYEYGHEALIDCDWNLFHMLPTLEVLFPHEEEEQQLDNQIPPSPKSSGDTACL